MKTGIPERTLADLDFARVLARLSWHTRTTLGEVLATTPRFFARASRVRHELELVSEMRGLVDAQNSPPFGGISDVRPILVRAAKAGTLDGEDLLLVAGCLRGVWLLRRFLLSRADDLPLLCDLAMKLPEIDGVHETLFDAFEENGELSDDATAALFELRNKKRALHERLRRRVQSMLHAKGVEERLMDSYYTVRDERYVLPVKSGERAEVDGIIHGSSHTGRTLFIEPAELVGLNNELKLCEQEVMREEHRILAELTRLVAGHKVELELSLDVAAEVDLIYGRARLAAEMDAHAPILSDDDAVRLDQARNPLLVLRGIPVVANDIEVGGERRLLVITGPNAGGKTVTLSTLGLCALMVRAGLHIPVGPDSRVPVYGKILTVLGDNQDLQADLSTFSGHLERLKALLVEASQGSLVLLDEIAVGTAPGQGAALAISVLESLVDRGAVGCVTTHYERLKTLSLENDRFQNAAVALDKETGEPTYRLRLGMPGSSSGLDMAERLGLPADIVARAREILGGGLANVEKSLQRLDAERGRLEASRAAVEEERAALDKQRRRLEREELRLQEAGEDLVRSTREEAIAELEEARAQIRAVVRELQRDPTQSSAHKRRIKLAEVEKRLQAAEQQAANPAAPSPAEPKGPAPLAPGEAVVGMSVYVPSLLRVGTITEIKGKQAQVSVGNIRTRIPLKKLMRPPEVKKPRSEPIRRKHSAAANAQPDEVAMPPRASDNTVDVRGHRLDEAVAKVEQFLDDAILRKRTVVYVLHGHGTGRLKSGLRDGFKRSRYVARYDVADPDKGGDAVTVVWLK